MIRLLLQGSRTNAADKGKMDHGRLAEEGKFNHSHKNPASRTRTHLTHWRLGEASVEAGMPSVVWGSQQVIGS